MVDTSYSKSYNSYGKKYEVPRKPVSSPCDLESGDHIAFHKLNGAFWHHAIIEDIDICQGEIQVIEYSNTVKGFIEDNFIPPRSPGIARVVRWTYNFRDIEVFLMLHQQCLDPASVVERARSKLGERKYNPLTNNCEHFAMWCKTGKSTSDQVNKIKWMVSKEIGSKGVQRAFTKAAAAKVGKVVVERGAGVAVRAAQEMFVREGTRVAARAAQEMYVREGTCLAVRAAQEMYVREGTCLAVRAAQEMFVREGTRVATRAGQEMFVREGTRMAARAGQAAAIVRAGGDAVSRGVLSQTVTGAGQGVATSSTSAIAPRERAVIPVVTEGLFMAYDIGCAHADMRAGRITQRECREVTGKRIVTGTSNMAGSKVGAVIGQAVIPVPGLGGFVGSVVGGWAGSFFGNIIANSLASDSK